MIKQAVYNLSLTRDELKFLAGIKPWAGKKWDNKAKEPTITAIKDKIRNQLESVQKVCSYCGLKLGGTSNGEIEHIAPKAHYRDPEFTFTLKNLTFSCHLCNGFYKKGTSAIIDTKKRSYSKCTFFIVHPYFDIPDQHFEWTDEEIEILIQVRDDSPKGKFSMKMFELDTPIMNELRAQQVRHEQLKAQRSLSIGDQKLIDDAINYK